MIELTTRRLIADNFDLEDLGIQAVKGIEQPTRVWRVLGEQTGKSLEASQVPFAGRRSELQRYGIVTECRDAGKRQVIYVRGEPGIGKTWFVEEVMRAAEAAGLASHRGVVLDFGAGPTQDPIRAVMRSLLEIEPGDDPNHQRSALDLLMESADLDVGNCVFLEDLLGIPHSTGERSIYDAMENDSRSRGKREVLSAIVGQLS